MRHLYDLPGRCITGQRGYLFPWAPVILACGIGAYFVLKWEPPVWSLWLAALSGAVMVFSARRKTVAGLGLTAMALVALGFGLAGVRAHRVAGPVLDFRYYGAIEGRVVNIDRSASDAVRLTLDRVVLEDMDFGRVPYRVRVSLHGEDNVTPEPGMVVILTGHLGRPGGAVEPGGFDFRRHAWFQQLGAVGYTRSPVLMLEPPGPGLSVFKARLALSARVQRELPGETGAFAAAIMTGDRSGMGQEPLDALRASNLAHLLAISGLHMGLLAGFVFAALRLGLLLVPRVRHHWPVKKFAAFGALLASAGYLALSGGNVATERAFVMVAVALTALMLDRRALSLRSVAIAALMVLVWQPEALLGPGFQMSFAATVALVAVFEQVTKAQAGRRLPRWAGAVLSLVVSSAVAGAATAPVGMAHFNQASVYGLAANLVSVPVMGVLVMPLAVVAAILMPLGLEALPLWFMGLGLDWILGVAREVSSWQGATRPVVAPAPVVLPLIAVGGLILCLWRGRGRLAGMLPVAVALMLWVRTDRPPVLIADTATLVGILTPEGRGLSRAQGAGFVASNWLENDGSRATQEAAAGHWPGSVADRLARAPVLGVEVLHVQGKHAARALTRCHTSQVVVSSVDIAVAGGCAVFDPQRLAQTGSVALWPAEKGTGLRMVTAAEVSGQRLWQAMPPEDRRLAREGGETDQ
ncbi:ComEC/Rec2 family competence protein [Sagittula salina]|uniref:ComEC family competence protein n=1 Tax=Sagittula salina TaxID=2820268 RepID=A0A940MN81_9RHOB|nr:ComEC/Rec2 family competence protein [Sagittula salina]MBP0481867.1 ComEC family competence protein [Sagittula salina]